MSVWIGDSAPETAGKAGERHLPFRGVVSDMAPLRRGGVPPLDANVGCECDTFPHPCIACYSSGRRALRPTHLTADPRGS